MAYLSRIGIVHRDLAARNVLLSSDFTCKISDFGLSSSQQNEPTLNAAPVKIATRWAALESIFDHQFTSKSDVWSFGVLMYEVFSEGAKPYVGWSNKKVVDEVKTGYRLPQPDGCPDDVYGLMLQCWYAGPDLRPDFEKLEDSLQDAVSAAAEVEKGSAPTVEQPRSNVLDRLNNVRRDAMLAESLQADSKSRHMSVVSRSRLQSVQSKPTPLTKPTHYPSSSRPLSSRAGNISSSRHVQISSPKHDSKNEEKAMFHRASYVALLGKDGKLLRASQEFDLAPPVHHHDEAMPTATKMLSSRQYSGGIHAAVSVIRAPTSPEPGLFSFSF
jgi:serine/threonine protein kinase